MSENNPSETVGGEVVNAPSPGTENVAPVASLKDIVKQATGREYSTDEAALEGIKNTYQMVGKKVEPQVIEKTIVPEEVVREVETLKKEVKVSQFYADHPEYKEVKEVISKFGGDPEQVIADPIFKKTYDALKAANENQNKPALSSNARIQAPPVNQDYARDLTAMREGTMNVAEFMAKHKGVPMPTEGT